MSARSLTWRIPDDEDEYAYHDNNLTQSVDKVNAKSEVDGMLTRSKKKKNCEQNKN